MEFLSFYMPGPWEIAIIAVVALLLFGRRLPEVGRSLGKGIVEFKKGLRGIEDEINQAAQNDKSDKTDKTDKTPPSQG
jgi:sec-independent protein translocase protein TatA